MYTNSIYRQFQFFSFKFFIPLWERSFFTSALGIIPYVFKSTVPISFDSLKVTSSQPHAGLQLLQRINTTRSLLSLTPSRNVPSEVCVGWLLFVVPGGGPGPAGVGLGAYLDGPPFSEAWVMTWTVVAAKGEYWDNLK